jgi:hypothetical protein
MGQGETVGSGELRMRGSQAKSLLCVTLYNIYDKIKMFFIRCKQKFHI